MFGLKLIKKIERSSKIVVTAIIVPFVFLVGTTNVARKCAAVCAKKL